MFQNRERDGFLSRQEYFELQLKRTMWVFQTAAKYKMPESDLQLLFESSSLDTPVKKQFYFFIFLMFDF